jgi:hypothetical protein
MCFDVRASLDEFASFHSVLVAPDERTIRVAVRAFHVALLAFADEPQPLARHDYAGQDVA